MELETGIYVYMVMGALILSFFIGGMIKEGIRKVREKINNK